MSGAPNTTGSMLTLAITPSTAPVSAGRVRVATVITAAYPSELTTQSTTQASTATASGRPGRERARPRARRRSGPPR